MIFYMYRIYIRHSRSVISLDQFVPWKRQTPTDQTASPASLTLVKRQYCRVIADSHRSGVFHDFTATFEDLQQRNISKIHLEKGHEAPALEPGN